MSAVRCVVFDVDDTLYLERDYVLSGFRAVGEWAARELGIDSFAERAFAEFEAGARGDIFDRALAGAGASRAPGVVQKLVSIYREHRPCIVLAPDAAVCLDRLHHQVRLAGLTDGPLASQRAKVEALQLARWLDPVVYTSALGEGFGKPDRRGFQLIEGTLGVSRDECAYVADNPLKDFDGPLSLGWRVARIRRAGGLHAARPGGPALSLPDLSRLPDMLGLT